MRSDDFEGENFEDQSDSKSEKKRKELERKISEIEQKKKRMSKQKTRTPGKDVNRLIEQRLQKFKQAGGDSDIKQYPPMPIRESLVKSENNISENNISSNKISYIFFYQ